MWCYPRYIHVVCVFSGNTSFWAGLRLPQPLAPPLASQPSSWGRPKRINFSCSQPWGPSRFYLKLSQALQSWKRRKNGGDTSRAPTMCRTVPLHIASYQMLTTRLMIIPRFFQMRTLTTSKKHDYLALDHPANHGWVGQV